MYPSEETPQFASHMEMMDWVADQVINRFPLLYVDYGEEDESMTIMRPGHESMIITPIRGSDAEKCADLLRKVEILLQDEEEERPAGHDPF